MPIASVCYLLGFLSFSLLSALLLSSWRGHPRGRWLIAATSTSAVWAGTIAFQESLHLLPATVIWCVDIAHDYVWIVFLSRLLHHPDRTVDVPGQRQLHWWVHGLSAALIAFVCLAPLIARYLPAIRLSTGQFFGQIALAVLGLVLVEQFYRNARIDQRWRIKFLCLALGGLFAYDFYLYSEALLFHRIRDEVWIARGAIAALMTPLIAVSAARNPDWSVDIFVSRQVVFHSAALLGAGAYLLLMATAGYYIRYYGGEWGVVAQIVFLVGAFLVLIMVMFSGQTRARLRIFLNKNFFNYAYDYRQEWLRLITTLSQRDSGLSLEQRIILALGQVVESPSGLIWVREPHGQYAFRADYGDPNIRIHAISANDPIVQFIEERGWIVNLAEMRATPEHYDTVSYPRWLAAFPNAWLLVPLWGAENEIDSLVLLTAPRTAITWNWEVIDMLKTTSRLAASYLALEQAAKELAEARQFDGFNRLSAFVIHDLKNLIAQLSLVVRNADKHHDNPEFMRDAIRTVDNAVGRMSSLMSQLRNANPAMDVKPVDICTTLRGVVQAREKQLPKPRLSLETEKAIVRANPDRLASAFEHVIHNAQDAAEKSGWVSVTVKSAEIADAVIVLVEDNGHGMDDDFIQHRLFKPFDTTKGLTGMGIGAYESREYARALGGDLRVRSVPGRGSTFEFQIPLETTGSINNEENSL